MQLISPSWHCERKMRRGPSHRLKTNLLCLAALFLFTLKPSVGWAQATRSVSTAVAFRAALEDPNVTQITITGSFTLERGHEATGLNGKKAYYNSIYIVQGTKTIDGGYHTIYRGTSYRNNTILLGVGAVLTINNLTFNGSNYVNFAPLFCTNLYPEYNPSNQTYTQIPVNGQLIMNNVTIKNCVSIDSKSIYFAIDTPLSAVPDNSYLINPFHPNTSNRLVDINGQPVNASDYTFIWKSNDATGGAAINFSPHKAAAASGNANNKITLANCTFQNNKVQKNVNELYTTGGAIFLGSANSKGGTFTDCRFEGNSAGDASVGQGGAICFFSTLPINTEFWFKGTTVITSNSCGNDGGGILIEGGKVVIDGKTDISYNTAGDMGGGIMLKGGVLHFQSTNNDDYVEIHHNEAGYGNGNAGSGGGICVSASEGTKLELSNNFSDKKVRLTISDNTCKGRLSGSTPKGGYGGGISIMTDGGSNWILADHKVELVSTSTNPNDTKRILISNNEAYYDGNHSKSNGGGISVAERAVATFTKCIIEGNKAEGNGGGISLRGSSVTFNGCLIENNYAWSSDGSAVYGGGVSVEENSGNNKFIGGIIKNNGDGTTYGTTTYGGGVSIVDGKVVFDGNDTEYGPCYILENKASDGGGGLYMDSDNGKLIGGCHVGDNTAINGGGIYYKKGGFENTNYVYSNTATSNGGGVYVDVSSSMELQGLVIGTNNAEANNIGNKARNGGGVYTYSSNGSNHCITINNCKIVYNKVDADSATIATGGGLCMANQSSDHSHTVELKGGTIIDHNEAVNGGGVYVTNSGTLTLQLTKATLSNNKATTGHGGGIYNNQTVTSAGATSIVIKGNEALAGDGGGLYNDGTCTLNNCQIGQSGDGNGNSAKYGGGIYNSDYRTTNLGGTTTFENNEATINGGGIFNRWQVTQAEGSTLAFVNNTASNNGGGVYHYRGTLSGDPSNLTLNGATFRGNHAVENGGGIYTNHTCILNGCHIGQSGDGNGNSALNGGGIYKRAEMLTINGGKVSNNTASNNGGGIYLERNDAVVNNNCHIEGNKATNDGGGIYLNGQPGPGAGNYKIHSLHGIKANGVVVPFTAGSFVISYQSGTIILVGGIKVAHI